VSLSTQRGCDFCGERYDLRFGHDCDDDRARIRELVAIGLSLVLLVAAAVAVVLAVQATP